MKVVVISVLLTAIANTAAAYQLKTTGDENLVRWPSGEVAYKIHVSASQSEAAAVRASFESWTRAAGIDLTYAGETSRADSGYDPRLGGVNENVVRFERTKWDADRSTLAVTFTLYQTTTGKIIGSDIVLNAVNYRWTTTGEPDAEDVQNTVTHEAGHFIGLSHTDVSGATMFPTATHGETMKRSLESDDVDGAVALYGVHTGAAAAGLESQPEPESTRTSTPTTGSEPAPSTGTSRGSNTDGATGCGGATITTRADAVSPLAALIVLAALLGRRNGVRTTYITYDVR